MVEGGHLSEADAYEVMGIMELLVERLKRDEITAHFARLVIEKLAEDKRREWWRRNGLR